MELHSMPHDFHYGSFVHVWCFYNHCPWNIPRDKSQRWIKWTSRPNGQLIIWSSKTLRKAANELLPIWGGCTILPEEKVFILPATYVLLTRSQMV